MAESDWVKEREDLQARLLSCEKRAAETMAEAAVCRDLIEKVRTATAEGNFSLLTELPFSAVLSTANNHSTERWGADFLHLYKTNARWLEHAKQALNEIKAEAEQLDVVDGDRNSEIKQKILRSIATGLTVHI
jgi:hypothetical protein